MIVVHSVIQHKDYSECGAITTTERNESCALIEGENHRETPEHTDIPLSVTNKMQRYTILFIAVEALHVSGGFSFHHQELKLYTYQTLCVQFELLMMGGKPPETCRASTAIKKLYNVASCWLYLKEYINDAQYHECQKY